MLKTIFILMIFFNCTQVKSLNMVASAVSGLFGHQNKMPEADYELESICFSTTQDSNNRMPTKVHLVIVYDHGTNSDLAKRKASEYFKMVDDLAHTHAHFLKILEWNFPAKPYLSPYIQVNYSNRKTRPVAMYLFTNVGGKRGGTGRYLISEKIKHVHVTIDKKSLKIQEVPVSVIDELKKYRRKFKSKK